MYEDFRHGRHQTGMANIAYVTGGEGPPLLLLHGFPQTKAMWAKMAPQLAERFTVVAADLRGYGDSSKPGNGPDSGNYCFRAMADDMVSLMRSLGHETFHLVGHDRGGRTAHRLTLDHPDAVRTLTVMDIIPTRTVFAEGGPKTAHAYYHWFFLSQPHPFPETLIGHDPDLFFENCLSGWGPDGIAAFDTGQLAEYRRCWRDPEAIRAMCADYRAAWLVDWPMDEAERDRRVTCPVQVLYGSEGLMARQFDVPAEWRRCCDHVTGHGMPGGHFFPDSAPDQTASAILEFLAA